MDIRTIVVANALSTAVCLFALFAIRVDARDPDASTMWTWAYALMLLNWLLVSTRGSLPDVLSIVVANAVGLAGLLVAYMGLRRFFDAPQVMWPNYMLVGALTLLLAFFTFLRPSLAWRDIIMSAAIIAVCAQAALFAFAPNATSLWSARNRIASSFVWLSLVAAARLARESVAPRAGDFMQPDTFDAVVLIAWGIGVIGLAFTLILLVNDDLVTELQSDIRSRKKTERRLRHISEHDELTGLLNGRAFRAAGMALLTEPGSRHVRLIYFDLDVLKAVNDRFGHAAGDEALATFAGVLSRSFRQSDVIGRLGGDEFAVLTVSREDVAADTLLSRYYYELAAINDTAGLGYRISASHGSSSWDSDDGTTPNLQHLVTEADERMYAIKAARHSATVGLT